MKKYWNMLTGDKTAGNFSYPSSAAAVVFGVYLSAQAAFRLDRKSPAVRPCRKLPPLGTILEQRQNHKTETES